jgi:hypothetical protein
MMPSCLAVVRSKLRLKGWSCFAHVSAYDIVWRAQSPLRHLLCACPSAFGWFLFSLKLSFVQENSSLVLSWAPIHRFEHKHYPPRPEDARQTRLDNNFRPLPPKVGSCASNVVCVSPHLSVTCTFSVTRHSQSRARFCHPSLTVTCTFPSLAGLVSTLPPRGGSGPSLGSRVCMHVHFLTRRTLGGVPPGSRKLLSGETHRIYITAFHLFVTSCLFSFFLFHAFSLFLVHSKTT